MGSGGSPFAFGGAVIGGAIGSIGAPFGGIQLGAQIGATLGTVVGSLASKPADTARGRDTRWGGCTYGTAISRGWGTHRTDAPIFWGVRNKDGTYLFKQNEKKRKKEGSQNVAHYRATFAFHILETGLTYVDGTQVERRIVIDRVWMADKVVWQSKSAVPIPAYAGNETKIYAYGEHALDANGFIYTSLSDNNVGHDPSESPDWWKKVSTGKNWNIRFHPDEDESTFTQAVDSVMATHDGILNTDAKRGSTYGLVDNEDMFDVGNAIPQNASVEWHWAEPCYLRDLLNDACGLSGMPSGSYDFSDVPDLLTGYRQTARQSGQDLIGSPLSIMGYDLVSIDGVVRAINRGGPIAFNIPMSALGATLGGQSVDLLEESILADPSELHSSLRVGYFDAAAGFRQSFQPSYRNDHSGNNPVDIPTDLVLTPVQAAQAAGRLHDTEWLEAGGTFGISILGDFSGLVGTDAITIPYRGKPRRFRVTGTQHVQNLIKAKLARDEPEVLVRYESASTTLPANADDGTIVPTAFVVRSQPTDLSNEFATFPGFYFFANGPEGWLGTQVVFTFDPPSSSEREWVDGPYVADPSTFGKLTTTLATATAGYESSTSAQLRVAVASTMAVPPSTLALANNGSQNAFVGDEVVGIVGASDLGSGVYRIGPGLVRGMRSSPVSAHAAGQPFASSLTVAATTKVQVDTQYIGQTVYVRALSPGQDLDDSAEQLCVIAQPNSPYVTHLPTQTSDTPSGAVNGTNAVFTLPHTPIAGSATVFVNGAAQASSTYTLTGTTLTFAVAPASGATILVSYSY